MARTPQWTYQRALELKQKQKVSKLSLKKFCVQQGVSYPVLWATLKRFSLIQPKSYRRRIPDGDSSR